MNQRTTLLAGMVVLLGSAMSARADYVFNFNTLGVSSGDNSAAVGTYMTGILGSTVTVVGAATDQKYNGDGHVTGPGNPAPVSLTLGTSDGATASNSNSVLNKNGAGAVIYDTFLANTTENSNGTAKSQISQAIDMNFATAQTGIVSFDYEIFPDISNAPDFTFYAYNGATLVATFNTVGVTPGTTNGNSTHSPSGSESNKQFIGTYTGASAITFTKLEFHDWPATIGVDNLKFSQVPEPRGVAFLMGGLMLALFAGTKLRKGLAKS